MNWSAKSFENCCFDREIDPFYFEVSGKSSKYGYAAKRVFKDREEVISWFETKGAAESYVRNLVIEYSRQKEPIA